MVIIFRGFSILYVSFNYNKIEESIDEVEKKIKEENISNNDMETVVELLEDIRCKINERKKPMILRSALVGLKDVLVSVGANVVANIIQELILGMFFE